jgi:DNA uptake protein ComE-like DNA-binding protein
MTVAQLQEVVFTPSGVKVVILSEHDEGEYKMVRSVTTGKVFFAHKGQIELVEATEEKTSAKPALKRRGRQLIQPEIPFENRVNINSATPERLTQVLKGVGIKTAVEIKELQQSMPGERFTKLDQLKAISRVDWTEVLEGGVVYVE